MEEQHAENLDKILVKIEDLETDVQVSNRQLSNLQSSVAEMEETLESQEQTLKETSSTVKTKFEKINSGLASLG